MAEVVILPVIWTGRGTKPPPGPEELTPVTDINEFRYRRDRRRADRRALTSLLPEGEAK